MKLSKRRVEMVRPMTIGNYTLTATGMEIHGRPGLDNHLAVGDYLTRTYQSVGLWLADWLRYGESREDWQGKQEAAHRLNVAVEATGLSPSRLRNIRSVAAIPMAQRIVGEGIEMGHYEAVVGLPSDDRAQWLERAQVEGWSVRDLRLELRSVRRRKVLEGQAVLEGLYRVVYADPPWIYGDRPASGSGAQQHYSGMTIEALCKLPVAAHCHQDSVLLMWATAPMMLAHPGPREVIEAWGFHYKTFRVWDKVHHAGGHYFTTRHEALTISTRGSCLPDRPLPMLSGVVTERQEGEHSSKPASFRADIERMWDGPRLELFGRERVEGWSVFGDDAALWERSA